MKKRVRIVCSYTYEGENTPKECLQCGVPASRFREQTSGGVVWAYEHEAGMVQGIPGDIMMDLRTNLEGECFEMGIYLVMSRAAHREGYSEVGAYRAKVAFEEVEYAAKLAELLGEVVTSSIKKNLEMRITIENGATVGKLDLVKRVKTLDLDVIRDTAREMARDEACHGKALGDLLNRYFG